MDDKYVKGDKLMQRGGFGVPDREIGTIKGDRVETKGFFTPTLHIERDSFGNVDLTETDRLSHLLSGTRDITRLEPDTHPLASRNSYNNIELTQEFGGRKVPKASRSGRETSSTGGSESSSSSYSGGSSSGSRYGQTPETSAGASRSSSASESSDILGGIGLLLAVAFLARIFSSLGSENESSSQARDKKGRFIGKAEQPIILDRQERRRKGISKFKKMFTLERMFNWPQLKGVFKPTLPAILFCIWSYFLIIPEDQLNIFSDLTFYLFGPLLIAWLILCKVINSRLSDGEKKSQANVFESKEAFKYFFQYILIICVISFVGSIVFVGLDYLIQVFFWKNN